MSEDEYFLSPAHRYIFLLLHVDGRRRNVELGIEDEHYESKRMAKKWYKRLSLLIHPDRCDHPKAAEAFTVLTDLYEVLTMDFD